MTDPATGFVTNLLTGLAVYLAAAPSIGATWSPTGAYTSGQTAIMLGLIPPNPDRCITLTAYPVDDSLDLSDSTISVQIRTRWAGQDPRPVSDLDDAIWTLLHGKPGFLTLSTGVVVCKIKRNSSASLGQDLNGRWMNSTNYYCDVWRPSTNRT